MAKVKVTARVRAYRRAGMKFTQEPVVVDVTAAQLKELAGDANLVVQVVKAEPKKTGGKER